MAWIAVGAATVAVAAAFLASYMAIRAEVRRAELSNRLDVQDDRIHRLQSKMGASERWEKEEIRDAVNSHLESLDIRPQAAGGELEAMMQMMAMMQPQQAQPQPQPEPASNGAARPTGLLGRGGRVAPDDE